MSGLIVQPASASSNLVELLGGSRVVIDGVRSRVAILISHIRGLITPLITTLNPKP